MTVFPYISSLVWCNIDEWTSSDLFYSGELCLQIPAVFWHNVQMYHWSTRPRCPVFGGNIWPIMAKSRMTGFTIGLSAIFVLGLGNWRTSLDLPSVPSSEIAHLEKGWRPWLVIIIKELLQFTILILASYVQPSKSAQSSIKIFTSGDL